MQSILHRDAEQYSHKHTHTQTDVKAKTETRITTSIQKLTGSMHELFWKIYLGTLQINK